MRRGVPRETRLALGICPYLAVYLIEVFDLSSDGDVAEIERLVGYGAACARDYLADLADKDPAHFASLGDTFLAEAAFHYARREIQTHRRRRKADSAYRAEAAALTREMILRQRRRYDRSFH